MVASPWDGLLAREDRRRLSPQLSRTVHTTRNDDMPPPVRSGSKAARVIELLRHNGPMRAEAILLDDGLDIPSASHLWAAMKYHINMGRVHVENGVYRMDREYEELLQVEIRAAVKLLRERGFTVEAP